MGLTVDVPAASPPAPLPPAPRLLHHELDALAADLAVHDVPAVDRMLGPVAAGALHREQPAAALAVTAWLDDPLAALVRVFVLGAVAKRAEVDRALPLTGVDGLERIGLAAAAGQSPDDDVVALVDLRPVTVAPAPGEDAVTWWIASDLGSDVLGAALHPDHVLGVGGASITLAGLTMPGRRRRVLDLGTGSGIQALVAARRADHVIATDISERALAFAGVNAALAGADLDLRRGSMLAPVFGEDVDLMVSNPPFVISPRGGAGPSGNRLTTYTYRDGGMVGDGLVAMLVKQAGTVLARGGVAQLMGNWEHRSGEAWADRVGAWIDASGLDGWVVQREVLDPAEYAEMWLRDGGRTREQDPAGWDAAVTSWLEDFARRGVDAVGMGFVVLRRPVRGVPTLRRLEEQHSQVTGPLGAHLARVLGAHDLLAGTDDDGMLGLTLRVAPDVTEERHLRPGAAGPAVILLRQGGGFGRTISVGTPLAALVGACDGDLTVGQLLGAVGAVLELPVADLRTDLLPVLRDLVRDGLLEVVEGD